MKVVWTKFANDHLGQCECGQVFCYIGDPDSYPPTADEMAARKTKVQIEGRPVTFFSIHDGDALVCSDCGRVHPRPTFDANQERRLLETRQYNVCLEIEHEKRKTYPDGKRLTRLHENLYEINVQLLKVNLEEKAKGF